MMGASTLLRVLGVSYERYRIFKYYRSAAQSSGNGIVVRELTDIAELQSYDFVAHRAEYLGPDAVGFGAEIQGRLVAAGFYWYGNRYKSRGFISLPPRGAKLVEIVTAPAFRGRGIATRLIRDSSAAMDARGFTPLLARTWHTNRASAAALTNAGWREIAMITTIKLPGVARRIRLGDV